jgi:thioredoxin reductase/Pyruvate/2-oxoacid:ferredoxin oxidoreductase delta subunit
MAGGIIIVLGYGLERGCSPVARHVASGIFGGEILIRGSFSEEQLSSGAVMERAGGEELERILPWVGEFAHLFGCDLGRIIDAPFTLIRKAGGRPYGNLYIPSGKVGRQYRPVHRNLQPPCAQACPVGIPNPIIIRYLQQGETEKAFDLIDEYTPFRYSCCGIACPGLCRAACTRDSLDRAVPIDHISRDYHPTGSVRMLESKKDRSIAVIGSGPAGLSAAWQLARRGYAIWVYEREENIGGKMVHSVPEQRLPRTEVERDLRRIESLDITFHLNTEVDAALFSSLLDAHAVVVIAVGATRPKRLRFPGEERAITSFEFLRAIKAGRAHWEVKNNKVVIIGAGNVAMDAACECHRLGASSVTALDMQKPTAFGTELSRAVSLGTRILFPRFVNRYQGNQVSLMNGENVEADLLIESVGEMPELDFAGEKVLFRNGLFFTNIPGVFIVGDASTPGLITHSIAAGRKAALAIHRQLRGLPPEEERCAVVDKRRMNRVYFQEQDFFFNDLNACMSCGTCIQCDICVLACPRSAIQRVGESFVVNQDVCTGCGVCASVCPRGAVFMQETGNTGTGAAD